MVRIYTTLLQVHVAYMTFVYYYVLVHVAYMYIIVIGP